jgi:hypothetical protein
MTPARRGLYSLAAAYSHSSIGLLRIRMMLRLSDGVTFCDISIGLIQLLAKNANVLEGTVDSLQHVSQGRFQEKRKLVMCSLDPGQEGRRERHHQRGRRQDLLPSSHTEVEAAFPACS